MSIIRYCRTYDSMQPDDYGSWVEYKEHSVVVKDLKQQLKEYQEQMSELLRVNNSLIESVEYLQNRINNHERY